MEFDSIKRLEQAKEAHEEAISLLTGFGMNSAIQKLEENIRYIDDEINAREEEE